MVISKILEEPEIFKKFIRLYSLFFIIGSIVLYLNEFKVFIILDLIFLSLILFTFSFIEKKSHCHSIKQAATPKKYLIFYILYGLLASIILIMLFDFYLRSGGETRIDWLHYYSRGFYLLIPALMPITLIISLYFERCVAVTILTAIGLIILDGTRMNIIYYAAIFFFFYKGEISINKIKLIIIFSLLLMVGISFLRIYPESGFSGFPVRFFDNFLHSFFGGYFIYNEHAQAVLFGKIDSYTRVGFVRMMPGIDVVASTLLDKLFGTNYSHGHYESIFYENHVFRYIEALGVEMNSYYTGLVIFKVGGYFNSFIALFIIFYGAFRSSDFGGPICKIWISLFLLSFDKYFINENPGFSVVYLVASFFGVKSLCDDLQQKFLIFKK